MEKRLPQLFQTKMKICYKQGYVDIIVVVATKSLSILLATLFFVACSRLRDSVSAKLRKRGDLYLRAIPTSLRASSPIWASEASKRERAAESLCPSRLHRSLARSRETRFARPNRRACSQATFLLFEIFSALAVFYPQLLKGACFPKCLPQCS